MNSLQIFLNLFVLVWTFICFIMKFYLSHNKILFRFSVIFFVLVWNFICLNIKLYFVSVSNFICFHANFHSCQYEMLFVLV